MNQQTNKEKRLVILLLGVLLLVSLIFGIKEMILVPYGTPGVDFGKHYFAAKYLVNGKSPYNTGDLYLSFNYPQFVVWTNLPLLFFNDVGEAEKAWDVFNVILVLLTGALVIGGYKPGLHSIPSFPEEPANMLNRYWWILALFFTFFYHPNTAGISQGNVSSWVLIFIALLGWAVLRGKHIATGVFIALNSLIKVMPFFLIIPFIIGRRKKVLLGAGAVWGIYFLVLLFTGTLKYEWFYVTKVLPNVGEYWGSVSYSLPYVVLRGVSRELYENSQVLQLTSTLWVAGMLVSFVYICWKGRALWKTEQGGILFFTLGVFFLPLIPPLLEYLHFVWSFPGFLTAYYLLWKGKAPSQYYWVFFGCFFILSMAGPLANVYHPGFFSLLAITPFIGLTLYICWGTMILSMARTKNPVK